MKNVNRIIIVVMALVMMCSSFAFADDRNTNDNANEITEESSGIILDLGELEPGKTVSYYMIEGPDGELMATTNPSSVAIFAGSITANSWVGNTINYTIRVTSTGIQMRRHWGTVKLYKVTSLGLQGAEINSATFTTSYSSGTYVLTYNDNINTTGVNKVFLKVINPKVEDIYGDITQMYGFFIRANKSNF